MKQLLLSLIFFMSLFSSPIERFSFQGNKRTTESTILKIADLEIGDSISDSILSRANQRLLKTELFTSCSTYITDTSTVAFEIVEKWAIIPFISFQGNGNEFALFNTGLYDANFLGKAAVIGGDYTYLYGTHSGHIFGMKDNIGSHNLKITGRIRNQNGINRWFDSTGAIEAGFLVNRKQIFLSAELPIDDKLTLSFSSTVLKDSLSESIGKINFDSLNSDHDYHFSGKNSAIVPNIAVRYSNFTYKAITYSGWGAKAGYARAFESEQDGYNSFSIAGQWYKELPLQSNFCINAELFGADGHGLTNLFYVGGMNGVRGFPDSFFRGKGLAKANVEYRIPSLNTKWITLQHVFFTDYALVSPRLSELDKAVSIGSGGLGIRIMSPKVYSFMIRFDYGWGLTPLKKQAVSFGTTHYFKPF